ncbi:hypothetical protein Ddye_012512 [Dipteronia dyeriana]|uniref:Uncharacterized protein n=1 Tax=Dipteronia dyeriana TaxID=168575 RepID=A0AAD9X4P3_9ROSI|nr:hypothetical protein Ddye_012512 [Dipteronia dyeriana]
MVGLTGHTQHPFDEITQTGYSPGGCGVWTLRGQKMSVLQVCMPAGAQIPERYKPMMRLDIEEEGLVA